MGCIPSKALLHVAAVMDEASHMAALGVDFGAPAVNVDKLRGHKEKVISKLTGGLAAMAKIRKVTIVRSYGAFVGANHVTVEETSGTSQKKTGKTQTIAFKKGLFPWTASGCAIANGRDEGVAKLLFDDSPEAHGHANILGGGMVGTHAGGLAPFARTHLSFLGTAVLAVRSLLDYERCRLIHGACLWTRRRALI